MEFLVEMELGELLFYSYSLLLADGVMEMVCSEAEDLLDLELPMDIS